MKRIFDKSTLRRFWKRHADSEQYLKTWYDTAMNSDWKTPIDIKQTYSNASILKEGRIVFNIKGNSYRPIVKFNFERKIGSSGIESFTYTSCLDSINSYDVFD